jgi:predicted RNase H-like nuclease (RuvC/YqgF family)
MLTYQSPESKKEAFLRYLENSGAIDSLTVALVNLYEEPNKPSVSTEYIQKHLGDRSISPGSAIMEKHQQQLKENETLKKENEKLKQKVIEMSKVIETLKANLNHLRAQARKAREGHN